MGDFDESSSPQEEQKQRGPRILCGPPEFRGIFGEAGDSSNWIETCRQFPNGVPRFESKDECVKFMTDYNTYNGGSNPDHPHLQHIFTTLITWDQIERILIPAIEKARKEPTESEKVPRNYGEDDDPHTFREDSDTTNVYEQPEAKAVFDAINYRLNVPFHKCTTPNSTINTLKYLFYHMKCGIFVMVRNGKIRIFCPFVNSDYRNTWSEHLKVEGDGSLDAYYKEKRKYYRRENIEHDKSKWWANGNIICNELTQEQDKKNMQHWGDQFSAPLRDMLAEACNQRNIPDCEFFLNKRDYPQLKVNISPKGGVPVEPYGFIFDKDDRDPEQDVDLAEEHKFDSYAPIVSFYAAAEDRFTDIPWPSSEDWEGACGLVFPQTFMHKKIKGIATFNSNPRDLFTEANFRKFERGWDDGRIRTAFFRGGATGGGTTIHNNQRLKCAYLGNEWKDDPERGGGTEEPFLDAAIVGWNLRDKKVAESPMTYLRQKTFNFTAGRHHFIPIYEQSKYKYLVYIDGHCAACRYAFMMRLGGVILKVSARQVADRMWFFPLLKPFVDHVPVKEDLSDLEDQIRWCRENDDKCREIAQNCQNLYDKYVARSALLDYVEMVCKSIAKRYKEPPAWFDPPPKEEEPPQLNKPDTLCYEDKRNPSASRLCTKCQEEKALEEKKRKLEEKDQKKAKKSKKASKQSLRERMRKRAAESKSKEAANKKQKR